MRPVNPMAMGSSEPAEGSTHSKLTVDFPFVWQAEDGGRGLASRLANHDEIAFSSTNTEGPPPSDVSMCDPDLNSEEEDKHRQYTSTAHGYDYIQPSSSVPLAVEEAITLAIQPESQKRNSSPLAHETSTITVPSKKAKIGGKGLGRPMSTGACPSDKSLLPAEIWHRVFTFVPPKALGNLLCTNKLFNIYLDPSSSFHSSFPTSRSQSHISTLKPDAIWQASRRRHILHKMPTPLKGKTELDMWRLACPRRCQFCGQGKPFTPSSSSDQWRCGPGPDGIRTIWTFGLTSCAKCLEERTMKEISVLLSPSIPSLLMSALPFVLTTNDMHIVPSTMLQTGQISPGLQVTKIFLSASIEKLRHEFLSVKEMGEATVEEWLKGLDNRGKEHRNDALRWEKWELSRGAVQMQSLLSLNCTQNPPPTVDDDLISWKASLPASSLYLNSKPKARQDLQDQDADSSNSLSRDKSLFQNGAQADPPRTRTREEALELKAARRAEIERRALELEPPLPANVLAHVPAFKAAIQITSPLDDNAWNLLKPRLLVQRANAEQQEQREQEITIHSRVARERLEQRRNAEGTSIEAKQLIDKDWDDIQGPLRAQIAAYADDIIRDGWNDGRKVNKENCPQFAAEVLLYVRRTFYKGIAEDAAVAHSVGQEPVQDPPEGPFTRKLTLENMKWLFDVKIKPRTEPYRKELFYCNGCEGNFKAYGFEGVVQHYAAKHTSALSLGTVVVHWRAEWPEISPFHPDPRSLKTLHAQQPGQPYKPSVSQNSAVLPQPNYHTYPSNSAPNSYHPPLYHNTPRPEYDQHGYNDQFGQPLSNQCLYGPSVHAPPQHTYGQPYPSHLPLHTVPYHPIGSEYPGPHGSYSNVVATTPPYPLAGGAQYNQNYNAHQNHPHFNVQLSGGPLADRYRIQLEDIARNSRELWTATAGLKELPGNIRVYVVFHHIVNKFRSRFFESPPLSLFIDGLSNNKGMRPVRNVNGLMCKACNLGLGNVVPADQVKKTFSLPQLVNHFQKQHAEQLQTTDAPLLDWSVDMVYIPDLSILSNLRNLPNMDDQKFALISDTFPAANYHGGFSQSFPALVQDHWANKHSYYGASVDTTVTVASQPPRYQTVSHQLRPQREALPQDLIDGYKPNVANLHLISTQNAQSHQHSPRIVHSKERCTSSQAISQHGNSSRTSPDAWLPSGEARPRKRKERSKDQRNTPGQSSKSRKSGGKSSTAGLKAREPSEEDTMAEEEERRQEEEIRAMWAADRRETARLVSTTKAQACDDVSSPRAETPNPRPEGGYEVHKNRQSPSLTYAVRPQAHPPPVTINDHEEIDLIAGLESQLNRQQASSEYIDYELRPKNTTTYESQPFYERQRNPQWHAYVAEGYTNDRDRSRSPIQLRYEPKPSIEQYRERSSSPRHPAPVYRLKAAPIYVDDVAYGRNPRQDYYDVRVDESHQYQHPPKYLETYELVKVRDSQGEYFIRRPIRHEQEATCFTYEDERPVYRNTYQTQETYLRQIAYDVAPSRQSIYNATDAPTATNRPPIYEAVSRNDPAALEEYDPRFPAALPSLGAPRQVQYE
ncbi:hypothetical protein F5X99DRAFT_388926 [Biscogniauxia marginata]|nr:hypothetical protein F5X99DRAFT_388926 [Biscogniauxia marginata]